MIEDDLETSLAWFVAHREELRETLGVKRIGLVEREDGFAYEVELHEPFEAVADSRGNLYGVDVYESEDLKLLMEEAVAQVHERGTIREQVNRHRQPIDIKAHVQEFLKPATVRHEERAVRPNDPCPCGSGRKFKKCCA